MNLFSPAAFALCAAMAVPAVAQTRADLRGPTGHQRVKLPPGVEGATGGQAHGGGRCRVIAHHRGRNSRCR